MKKLFTILALLAFLVVPAASMAMVQTSDADLAAITGQSGVDMDITGANINLSLGTFTWGDYDGIGTIANAGFINVAFYQAPMHIVIGEVLLSIDVNTFGAGTLLKNSYGASLAGKTGVVLNIAIPGAITVDAILADVVLGNSNGAAVDYMWSNGYAPNKYYDFTDAQAVINGGIPGTGSSVLGGLNSSTLGVFGISLISVKLTSPLNIVITAH
jgi:hypothetical protein